MVKQYKEYNIIFDIEQSTMSSTGWKLDEYGLRYNDHEAETDYDHVHKLKLKVSPNGLYAAVCNIHSYYTDFYKLQTDDDSIQYPKYMYSLRRNTYRTEGTDYLLEFFTSPVDATQTLFIFNLEHGNISVCDVETGKVLHTDCNEDKFLTSYKMLTEYKQHYLYIEGWYWGPVFFTALYKIHDLLTTPSYQSILLDSDLYDAKTDRHIRLNKDDDMIDILPTDNPFNTRYSIVEYVNNHQAITEFARCVTRTEMIINSKDNLLHKICETVDTDVVFVGNARARLIAMVTKPLDKGFSDLVTFKCMDRSNFNQSKDPFHIAQCFAKPIQYSDESLKYLIPRVLAHGFTRFARSGVSLVLNLERQGSKVKITIDQKFKRIVGEQHIYEVDNDEPCYIKVE